MIHVVVALKAEATSLIDRYQLHAREPKDIFPIFRNESIELIVSGIGKLKSASACSYLYALTGRQRDCAWLNLGVAGHRDLRLGQAVLAHQVTDAASSRRWYPPQLIETTAVRAQVITVDHPETDYPCDAAYDMEAAGFCSMASKCSTMELVQVYKVMSDNRTHATHRVKANDVQRGISDNLDDICAVITQMQVLSEQLSRLNSPPRELDKFIHRWHFTTTQRHQLKRLLQRWDTLLPHESVWQPEVESLQKARDVLGFLCQRLDALAIRYGKHDQYYLH